jgi:N-acetyl-anhydromuramyl-L-alanine amidase AmpD
MLKINQLQFDPSQYIATETQKKQIVLHHTASPANSIQGDIDWWQQTKERVATHFIIGYDGAIYQLFPLQYYAFHCNVAEKSNTIPKQYKTYEQSVKINQQSVGIELDCGGALTYRNGRFSTWYNGTIREIEVCRLRKIHRGSVNFHRYSDEQVNALGELLGFLVNELAIDLSEWRKTDVNKIFDLDERAYTGKSGIYTHNSYQINKNDIYPDSRIIAMLQKI